VQVGVGEAIETPVGKSRVIVSPVDSTIGFKAKDIARVPVSWTIPPLAERVGDVIAT